MARLSEIARITIGDTEVARGEKLDENALNAILLRNGIDPETGLHVSSPEDDDAELREKAEEAVLEAARALWPSFRRRHPSAKHLTGKILLEENPQRAMKMLAAYLNLTGNGAMPEYGLIYESDYRGRGDTDDEADEPDEPEAEEEFTEANLGRQEGLEAEYPEGCEPCPRAERRAAEEIVGYEPLVRDGGKEIAEWLASLSDEDLDFFIGKDIAPLLTPPAVLKRLGGKVAYRETDDSEDSKDSKKQKRRLVSGVFRKSLENAAFRSGYYSIPWEDTIRQFNDQWVMTEELLNEALDALEGKKKRKQGWGVSIWDAATVFARAYDVSSREKVLAAAASATSKDSSDRAKRNAADYLASLGLQPGAVTTLYKSGDDGQPGYRDRVISAIAVVYGRYTRTKLALAWGGFSSADEAKEYLEGLNLQPRIVEEIRARVFKAMSQVFAERQDFKKKVVGEAQQFARKVGLASASNKKAPAEAKLVSALGAIYSPYLRRNRTFALNWGGFDSLDEAQQYLSNYPLPGEDIEYLRKKVTYAIYAVQPRKPNAA